MNSDIVSHESAAWRYLHSYSISAPQQAPDNHLYTQASEYKQNQQSHALSVTPDRLKIIVHCSKISNGQHTAKGVLVIILNHRGILHMNLLNFAATVFTSLFIVALNKSIDCLSNCRISSHLFSSTASISSLRSSSFGIYAI